MSSSTSPPPPSPSKTSALLRKVVTGVTSPISPEEHAKRWGRSPPPAPTSSTRPATQTGSVSARVAAFEAASLSRVGNGGGNRAYERVPLPLSPVKTSFAGAGAGGQRGGQGATSPTVPASFFQQQQLRRSPQPQPVGGGEMGKGAYAPRSQQLGQEAASAGIGNKENHQQQQQQRSAGQYQHQQQHHCQPSQQQSQPSFPHPPSRLPSPPSSALPLPSPTSSSTSQTPSSPPMIPLPLSSPLSLLSASYSPTPTEGSEVSVCTMATRSSDSTHASSLVSGVSGETETASVEKAKVGVARRVVVPSPASSPVVRQGEGEGEMRRVQQQQAPRIVETAPTPKKPSPSTSAQYQAPRLAHQQLPSSSAGEQYQQQQQQQHPFQQAVPRPQPQPQPHPPQHQRAISAFSESLPASYPSSPTSPYDRAEQAGFRPLPLDHQASSSEPREAGKGRKRANTLGAREGAEQLGGQMVVESREEKEKRVDEAFGRLLDTMQLPDRTVRLKMLSLALPLKEEMLRSASVPSPSSLSPGARPTHARGRSLNVDSSPNLTPIQTHQVPILTSGKEGKKEKRGRSTSFGSALGVRKTKSSQSLRASAASATVSSSSPATTDQPRRPSHSRTPSASSLFRSLGRSTPNPTASPSSSSDEEDATFWAVRIRSASVGVLEVKEVGRLRGRLRSEQPGWVEEFLRAGGYKGLCERLGEVLGVEWREEQHDDQILYELLRCFKALTLTSAGRHSLSSLSPTPFLPLASLLFSEKRPGDLPCRQLLVELLQAIFDVAPSGEGVKPVGRKCADWEAAGVVRLERADGEGGSGGVRRYTRPIKGGEDAEGGGGWDALTPERKTEVHRFVYSLMQGPPNEKEEAKLDFIQQTHQERAFKVWVTELSDCVRDYFWIFCHSQNLFWSLEQIDQSQIEAPKVPSGMTGGVEYEAMAYCAAHFRLLNALAKTCPSREEAFKFHNDLFDSGLERVLLTLRRASLVYYQSLHLEMSRYIALARSVGFNLGPRILACLDARSLGRQEQMVLQMAREREAAAAKARGRTESGAPQLGEVQF
ncbi:hypothetical protein BCR35DRAFT_302919 [Leucosporidium creatinivorum]|uniref:Formin GTPase-binding domain-containing protein n=1 Tax=Leucosporidium creatinivorum TaxID=106004 RepID=A0A1Y2FPI2_9BASI|nr:hypothetical protein BCR35DRAFT_302919 [Leucosporidium creatinivorum]